MNELKELSKKIKENTTLKEEKKSEPEIKNLFENFLSNNSLNYLSSFINKTNLSDKPSENTNEGANNEGDDVERVCLNRKIHITETSSERENSAKDVATTSKKLKIEKRKKSKECLEGSPLENKNVGNINIKKILQNKKNIEFKDLNKLINSFNDEIVKRSKNLEIFINKNKIKNDYSDKILMIEKFNKEMKIIEQNFKGKDHPLYELYLEKKRNKKTYESLIFFKNFFNCLKNYAFFLDKSEKNYKKLKIWKSLVYLRNCKTHILLIKSIFKCAKDYSSLLHIEDANEKHGNEKKGEANGKWNINTDDHDITNIYTPTSSDSAGEGKKEAHCLEEKEKCQNKIGYNANPTSNSVDSRVYSKLMEELKGVFQGDSVYPLESDKRTFLKEIKIKYEEMVNNLRSIVRTIFEKMFVFGNSIKIYKYVYLNSGDIFLEKENDGDEKISYYMFWYFAYILKEHTTYLGIVKKNIFLNFFKLMVLFYCVAKNVNAKDVLNKISETKHASSLTYKNVKNFVTSTIGGSEKDKLSHSSSKCVNRSEYFVNSSRSGNFNKFRNYMFCADKDETMNRELTNGKKKKRKYFSWNNINLHNYIVEKEHFILIDVEAFFSNFLSSLECVNEVREETDLPCMEGNLKREYLNNNGDEIFLNRENENGRNLGKHLPMNLSDNNGNVVSGCNDCGNAMSGCNDGGNAIPWDEQRDGASSGGRNEAGEDGLEFHDFFSALSHSLLELYNIIELLFVINKEERDILDIQMEENVRPEELVSIFNFYFDNEANKNNFEQAHFKQYIYDLNDEEKLNNVREKLNRKYQYMKEQRGKNEQPNNATFPLYILNKELNENIFSFFHKMNLKRNNLKHIYNVHYVYRWKREEQKFLVLIKNIFKNNFFYYLNYTYSLLNGLLHGKEEENGEYILINKNTDDYIFNTYFDIYNDYTLRDAKEINSKTVMRYVEEEQGELEKNIKERVEKIIAQKNTQKGGIDIPKGEATDMMPTSVWGKTNEKRIHGNEQFSLDENREEMEKQEHDLDTCTGRGSISITIKRSNIDCIRIHKNLIYLVFTIYRVVHFSYIILTGIEQNDEKSFLSNRYVDEIKKEKHDTDTKLKYIINVNTVLFCYKLVKYIYNMFLSYSFFIFSFSCSPNLNNKEFLLSLINDSIFLKKVLENINDVYLRYRDLFNLYISEEDIIFESFEEEGGSMVRKDDVGIWPPGVGGNWPNSDSIKHEYGNASGKIVNASTENVDAHLQRSSNYNYAKHNFFNKYGMEMKLKTEKEWCSKSSKKKNVLCINKISVLKRIHLFIDKFDLNLKVFQDMFLKIYKENFVNLLRKDNIFTEEIFLINTSKIVSIIFDIFQTQDLCKLIHTDVTLRLMDYFFYLINEHIQHFVQEKRRIDENEKNLLYDKFIFIQNSVSFILNSYREADTYFEQKHALVQEEYNFLKIIDDMCTNLVNLKKNKILFLLLFCKIKYILNEKRGILEMYDTAHIHLFLSNNPYVYEDENFDAILNEFK
ncbi:hypothetical protein, conserved [Plasmodium ovale wallikeri]|uniref:Uncharacterized protein n=1 Tax=Plasmodium ovale wallikeri TaxID=864142 RepID=A0A1A8Z0H6_PLAOA|nr:hypothetical protein, conserved [Plasmodium ovale wallikeri]